MPPLEPPPPPPPPPPTPPALPGGLFPWLAGLIAAVLIVSAVIHGFFGLGNPAPPPAPPVAEAGGPGTPPPLPSPPRLYYYSADVNSVLTALNSPRPAGTTPCPFRFDLTIVVKYNGPPPTDVSSLTATVKVAGGAPLPDALTVGPMPGPGQASWSWTITGDGTWDISDLTVTSTLTGGGTRVERTIAIPDNPIRVSCAPS